MPADGSAVAVVPLRAKVVATAVAPHVTKYATTGYPIVPAMIAGHDAPAAMTVHDIAVALLERRILVAASPATIPAVAPVNGGALALMTAADVTDHLLAGATARDRGIEKALIVTYPGVGKLLSQGIAVVRVIVIETDIGIGTGTERGIEIGTGTTGHAITKEGVLPGSKNPIAGILVPIEKIK